MRDVDRDEIFILTENKKKKLNVWSRFLFKFSPLWYLEIFRFRTLEKLAVPLSFKILVMLLLKSQLYAKMLPVCKCGKICGNKCLYSSINLRGLEALNLIIQISPTFSLCFLKKTVLVLVKSLFIILHILMNSMTASVV
jgi:hypothetical protein